jgi:hypothetical protein
LHRILIVYFGSKRGDLTRIGAALVVEKAPEWINWRFSTRRNSFCKLASTMLLLTAKAPTMVMNANIMITAEPRVEPLIDPNDFENNFIVSPEILGRLRN